jgi:DNA relaxase NicK
MILTTRCGDGWQELQPEPEGEWVRYEDAQQENQRLRVALSLILDNVDYIAGNCRFNEMVGAVLPKEILAKARAALADPPKPQ